MSAAKIVIIIKAVIILKKGVDGEQGKERTAAMRHEFCLEHVITHHYKEKGLYLSYGVLLQFGF